MIRSMTGFGRGEYSDGSHRVSVEIKTVNHRYCDVYVKIPKRYLFAEDAVRQTIKETMKRGKADVAVTVEALDEADVNITLNKPVLDQYVSALERMKDDYGAEGSISLDLLSGLPDVFQMKPADEDEDALIECFRKAAAAAGENLDKMRQIEGGKLAEDLLERGGLIRGYVAQIRERSASVPKEYRDRLKSRIEDLLEGTDVELSEDRLAVETAVFADKCDITEELTRLDSHLDQLEKIIAEAAGVDGKKLDFLIQEMNREANTIGSKANDLTITNLMLKVKAEVEKIREQVQNIQ